jgi:hypothetical protein
MANLCHHFMPSGFLLPSLNDLKYIVSSNDCRFGTLCPCSLRNDYWQFWTLEIYLRELKTIQNCNNVAVEIPFPIKLPLFVIVLTLFHLQILRLQLNLSDFLLLAATSNICQKFRILPLITILAKGALQKTQSRLKSILAKFVSQSPSIESVWRTPKLVRKWKKLPSEFLARSIQFPTLFNAQNAANRWWSNNQCFLRRAGGCCHCDMREQEQEREGCAPAAHFAAARVIAAGKVSRRNQPTF